MRELADGYALRYPSEAHWLDTLTEFIRFERDYCPFFRFEFHAEPQHGPLWLQLHGQEGVKEFDSVCGVARSATGYHAAFVLDCRKGV